MSNQYKSLNFKLKLCESSTSDFYSVLSSFLNSSHTKTFVLVRLKFWLGYECDLETFLTLDVPNKLKIPSSSPLWTCDEVGLGRAQLVKSAPHLKRKNHLQIQKNCHCIWMFGQLVSTEIYF